ncbi:MAG: DUF1223 domain-containing protein [Pseudomonadota bacterium]
MRGSNRTSTRNALAAIAALVALPMASTAALAGKPVVELFTSQGCSSCPPADKLLSGMAERRDIVALSFNVDYWDYLGWKDTLAKPAFTKRQRNYARFRGDGEVYTPQAIINGKSHIVGSDSVALASALKSAKRRAGPELTIAREGSRVSITISGLAERGGRKATIWVAAVQPKAKVKIRHGENSGRVITYRNVVRDLIPVGTWIGEEKTIEIDERMMSRHGAEACAILIQSGSTGPILAAEWLSL